jgi:pyrimidine operon attenuation protein/uracil phosphoribosyltransferase
MQILLSAQQFNLTIRRLAHQLMEDGIDFNETVFVALQTKGVFIGDELMQVLKELNPGLHPQYGSLDITFYRDDFRSELHAPKETSLKVSVEGKRVILIDDVLYTGRTIRAALDALQDFGRAKKIQLLVLVNRRFHRELPIQPDYCGLETDTTHAQKVKVELDRKEVVLL